MLLAMKESKVSETDQFIVYRGVRIAGESAWGENGANRKSGAMRIIPSDKTDVPPNLTWPDYLKNLRAVGIKEPQQTTAVSYCELGNTTNVP